MTGVAAEAVVHGLDADHYTDERLLRLERDRVLRPSWQFVGHVSDLPAAGTALRFDLLETSVFVLRAADGSLRAFANACRHRGTRLIEGDAGTGLAFCVAGRVRCPYHGWTYDDSGALVHVPAADGYPGLEPSQLGLTAHEVAVWHGLVFVAPGPPSPSWSWWREAPTFLDTALVESLRRSGQARLTSCSANWKVLCEQWLDTRHLEVAQPRMRALFAGPPRAPEEPELVCAAADLGGVDAGPWSIRGYARRLRAAQASDNMLIPGWRRLFLAPNTIVDVFPDHLWVAQFLPVSADRTILRDVVYALPDGSSHGRVSRYLAGRLHANVRAQSLRLAERVQKGLSTSAHTGGPIATDEPALRAFIGRIRREVTDGRDEDRDAAARGSGRRRRRRRS
jgi:phenylpropionate dioxygenase-like ring-hydroxylating dioxygenase large terminal subunit